MEPYIGQLALFGFNFAPRGWAFCDGSLLSIMEYTPLFALLGTTYGGDGRTTFGLPDLRGRAPIHFGQGSGLSYRSLGESGGAETVTLTTANLPNHTHALFASSNAADPSDPTGNVLATCEFPLYSTAHPDTAMAAASLGLTGGSQPISIMPPFLVLNWCIALQGVFPSRS